MSIALRLNKILDNLPLHVTLVAVSKFHPADAVQQAYDAGQRVFGESRVQELAAKAPLLPDDIRWHFIGHLQTNKVRQLLALKPALIESVDSVHLLDTIDKEALRLGFTARVLMQVHVAAEETKFGFTPQQLLDFFTHRAFESLKATHICGVMGMATNTDDTRRIAADFDAIAHIHSQIIDACHDLRGFDTISMGMSDDYTLAIQHGSTMVRIGTTIFGSRQY